MITLVTGGQRSGKSKFAEILAMQKSANPIYLATAKIWDEDFRKRVQVHQNRRGTEWTTIEEYLKVGDVVIPENSCVLLDCLTLLATNWMFECNENIDEAMVNVSMQLDMLFSKKANFIVVTNEIGMGGVSENKLQRKFTDLQGSVNQYVAAVADEVFLIVSGIPVKIK